MSAHQTPEGAQMRLDDTLGQEASRFTETFARQCDTESRLHFGYGLADSSLERALF
jgi:hypothetical protein